MKKVKVTILLMLAVVIPTSSVMPVSAAKTTTTISKKIYVGNTLKLKVKKKNLKWKSKNKKIATVKNGKIHTKKTGKVIITAKKGKSVYKFKITVKKHTIASLRNKINKYFSKHKKSKYLNASEYYDYESSSSKYCYIVRTTARKEPNVLVGSIYVNPSTGRAEFLDEVSNKTVFNIF